MWFFDVLFHSYEDYKTHSSPQVPYLLEVLEEILLSDPHETELELKIQKSALSISSGAKQNYNLQRVTALSYLAVQAENLGLSAPHSRTLHQHASASEYEPQGSLT